MNNNVYSKRKYLKEYEGFSDEEIDEMFKQIEEEKGSEESRGLFGEE